jgi:hypothetical protein
MNNLHKLLSIASSPIAQESGLPDCLIKTEFPINFEIQHMLTEKKGFSAFESALVVFPSFNTEIIVGLDSWNREGGWRRYYEKNIPPELFFFAQDLFCNQFGVLKTKIVRFDPESGELNTYANSLEEWAKTILANYAEDTGWPLAHDWQVINGPLPVSHRLLPRQPFVLGGNYVIENLLSIENQIAMDKLGQLFQVIKNVPDGYSITLDNWIEKK